MDENIFSLNMFYFWILRIVNPRYRIILYVSILKHNNDNEAFYIYNYVTIALSSNFYPWLRDMILFFDRIIGNTNYFWTWTEYADFSDFSNQFSHRD